MNLSRELGIFANIVNDGIGNLLLFKVKPDLFMGNDHDLFIYLLKSTNVGILPANAFGFPLQKRNAWFRITTIHDSPNIIGERLEHIAKAIHGYKLKASQT